MNTTRPVNPLNNLFILHLLGSEENKDLLFSFVNAVFTKYGHPQITHLTLLNPFNIANFKAGKLSIVDIKAETEDGNCIIVEVQINQQPSFAERSLYYWAYNYQKQLKSAETYTTLSPVICINLIGFILFPEITNDYLTCFQISEKHRPEYILTDHLQIFFIELEKLSFIIDAHTEFSSDLEQWCCFLKSEGLLKEEEMSVLTQNNPAIKKAHSVYEHFVSDPEKMAMLEAQEKWEHDFANRMEGSYMDGLSKGEKKGVKKGVKKTARNMLSEGIAIETIARVSGLSPELIASWKEERTR